MVTAALVVVVGVVLAVRVSQLHNHLVEHYDRQTKHLERFVMSATQDAVNAVVAQLVKAKGEIVAKIADVQAQLDAAQVPAEVVDLSALNEAAQALDDIVPDAVVDPAPEPEPSIDPVPSPAPEETPDA